MVLRRVNKLLQNTVNENVQCTILEERCGISLVEYYYTGSHLFVDWHTPGLSRKDRSTTIYGPPIKKCRQYIHKKQKEPGVFPKLTFGAVFSGIVCCKRVSNV